MGGYGESTNNAGPVMKAIKEMPPHKRPREKLIERGAEVLSDVELVAILLGSGTKGKSVFRVAKAILRKLDKEGERLEAKSLIDLEGVGLAKACQILAAFEFSRRRFFRNSVKVRKAQDVLPYLADIASKRQEYFLCISLNGANEVIGSRVVTVGLVNSSQIHPREVFANVISDRAASVILAHNHPSGVLEPSVDDMAVTKQMVGAGELLGIPVLDHIIISPKGYLSFKEKGLI